MKNRRFLLTSSPIWDFAGSYTSVCALVAAILENKVNLMMFFVFKKR